MMRIMSKLAMGLACLGVMAATSDALARSRHGHAPVVVERRSFLDPGTQVPVGSTNRYMAQQTFYRYPEQPVDHLRGNFMGETLPRRGEQPWDPGLSLDFLP